jgi:hypothetical protein
MQQIQGFKGSTIKSPNSKQLANSKTFKSATGDKRSMTEIRQAQQMQKA